MKSNLSQDQNRGQSPDESDVWAQIREALRDLQYGSLVIVVQAGQVVQIERTEKRRIHSGQSHP
ncbi:MAG: YezD family protein [Pirellulales bacterium]